MEKQRTPGRKVTTLETTCRILESLMEINGGTVTEIADSAGLAKSTVHAHLKTLRENNYVVRTGNDYDVGLRFLNIGLQARKRIEGFPLIQQKAEMLAEEVGELVVFITEENGRGVVLIRERGVNAVESAVRTGNRVPLHATAAGKAIMAHWPRERVDAFIEEYGLVAKTERTITDKEKLYSELNQIREQGYAVSSEEHTTSLHTFSAPVVGADDTIIGGLSLSGPSKRMQDDEYGDKLTGQLLGAVNELELKIKYS